jgi:hypothetical protein
MIYYAAKLLVSATIIVVVSEVAKRSGFWGGLIASLPLVSILAITWLYFDTHDVVKVAALARSTVWFVVPSLPFFVILPVMLQTGRSFWMSMGAALISTAISYVIVAAILKQFGLHL